jgi:hypothetical protein
MQHPLRAPTSVELFQSWRSAFAGAGSRAWRRTWVGNFSRFDRGWLYDAGEYKGNPAESDADGSQQPTGASFATG